MLKLEDEKRYLGIDFGTKRIGLALTDPLFTFAYPFDTIKNDDKLWNELEKIIKEKAIIKVVLGYPTTDRGDEQEISQKVKKFKEEFDKRYGLDAVLWDERYSSIMAYDQMISSVTKKSKRRDKGIIDRNSAAIILNEFLESEKKANLNNF